MKLLFTILSAFILLIALTNAQRDSIKVTVTIYDHHPLKNTNFQKPNCGVTKGLIQSNLNPSTKIPVLNSQSSDLKKCYDNTTTFPQFFQATNDVNIQIVQDLEAVYDDTARGYVYANSFFFPINNLGWDVYPELKRDDKDTRGIRENFHFCLKFNAQFKYKNQGKFDFFGDDDVYLFINNKLVMDLGGVHGSVDGSINVNGLGLVAGNIYDFDFYFCERHTSSSALKFTTDFEPYCASTDYCGACNGKGECCFNNNGCDDNDVCTIDTCPPANAPGLNPNNWKEACTHQRINATADAADLCFNMGNVGGQCKPIPVQCNNPPSKCHVAQPCNTLTGCSYTAKTCTPTNPANKCQSATCDASTGDCKTITKTCTTPPNATLCGSTGTCNGNTGECEYQCCPKDLENNNCISSTCSQSGSLVVVDKCAAQSTPCNTFTCQPVNDVKTCVPTFLCDDENACTTDSCKADKTGCLHEAVDCNDDNVCTIDSCNSTLTGDGVVNGCFTTDVVCEQDPEDLCTVYACDKVKGCIATPVVCPIGDDLCNIPSCNKTIGCLVTPKTCVAEDDECQRAYCNAETGECITKNRSPTPFNCLSDAAKGGIISSAAIAGIAIGGAAAAALFAFAGKKGYDYWKEHKETKMSSVNANPLYEMNTRGAGENPLFTSPDAAL
ncbi:hypothetical protein DFA_02465 [Cavenderia fasciculata]|uniref:PA14 domain-containing protein n=1 Tax=Cavenderia fasciculata TaxID=261658 RepID=F4PZI8_CACFS|nr:uncharacterized protein DFA_02465 [Cavenderia fasciculata]EGG19217.1 hypothetical protein DFA_02465 [Cavenderia fasciculata]|eukprot:XP_004366850.1 hypothetical protein DFA_02465 [Cavenderia fasciculata]